MLEMTEKTFGQSTGKVSTRSRLFGSNVIEFICFYYINGSKSLVQPEETQAGISLSIHPILTAGRRKVSKILKSICVLSNMGNCCHLPCSSSWNTAACHQQWWKCACHYHHGNKWMFPHDFSGNLRFKSPTIIHNLHVCLSSGHWTLF